MFDRIGKGMWWDQGWQLVSGCTPVSTGCDNCWARAMDKRFGNTTVKFHPERLDRPLKRKKPTVYAIWNDLFHEDMSDDFINSVMWHIVYKLPKQHIFLLLTKRAKRMHHFFLNAVYDSMPDNVWLGVTAENQETADERIPLLLQTPAAKRFISVEPMLGEIDLTGFSPWYGTYEEIRKNSKIDWVICGGETGPKARDMNPDWARDLRDQCKEAGVPFFFKQMTKKAEIPEDLLIREIPELEAPK